MTSWKFAIFLTMAVSVRNAFSLSINHPCEDEIGLVARNAEACVAIDSVLRNDIQLTTIPPIHRSRRLAERITLRIETMLDLQRFDNEMLYPRKVSQQIGGRRIGPLIRVRHLREMLIPIAGRQLIQYIPVTSHTRCQCYRIWRS